MKLAAIAVIGTTFHTEDVLFWGFIFHILYTVGSAVNPVRTGPGKDHEEIEDVRNPPACKHWFCW